MSAGALFWSIVPYVTIAILVVGLIYEWRQGALDFGPKGRRLPRTAGRVTAAAPGSQA